MSERCAIPIPALPKSIRKRSSSFEEPASKRPKSGVPSRAWSIQDWVTDVERSDGAAEAGCNRHTYTKGKLNSDTNCEPEIQERDNADIRSPNARCVSLEALPATEKLTREALRQLGESDIASSKAISESSSAKNLKDANLTAYDDLFASALERRGIYLEELSKAPTNLSELLQTLKSERPCSSYDDRITEHILNARLLPATEKNVIGDLFKMVLPIEVRRNDFIGTDEPWDVGILIKPEIQPALAVPKADRTIGWVTKVFAVPYIKATQYLGCAMRPIPMFGNLAWPYCTVELKSETGSLRVADLQNLHNAAVILNNMLKLMESAGEMEVPGEEQEAQEDHQAKEEQGAEEDRRRKDEKNEFFNKIRALSVQFHPEMIALSCYWASRDDGEVKYYGRRIETWFTKDPAARTGILSALRWMREENLKWINKYMEKLEGRLEKLNHGQELNPGMTPPASRSGRGTGVKSTASDKSLKRKASKQQCSDR